MNLNIKKISAIAIFALVIAFLGLFLPEIVFEPRLYINASNITVVGSAAFAGSIQNISEINNGYFTVNESNTPFYVEINFTNVTNFSFLEVKTRYFAETGAPSTHDVDIEVFCPIDAAFDDSKELTNHDDWNYFTLHFPDSSHFIKPDGNVTIRLNHTANGNANHRLWVDAIRLIILPQYEESTVFLNQTIISGSSVDNGTIQINESQVTNLTTDLNSKVNKSGDNMTGKLYIHSNLSINRSIPWTNSSNTTGGSFEIRNNGNITTIFRDMGTQSWFIHYNAPSGVYGTGDFGGMIGFTVPAGGIGFTFRNSSAGRNQTTWQSEFRHDLYIKPALDGTNTYYFCIAPGSGTGGPTCKYEIYSNGSIRNPNLTGTGNAYQCVDANGFEYRGAPGC